MGAAQPIPIAHGNKLLLVYSGTSNVSNCVACGPTSATLVQTKGEYRIVQCNGCSLIYVEGCGELGELEKFYGASYFSGEENTVFGYRDYRADRQLHLRNSHALLAVIERSFKGSGHRLLELGCAYGFLLEAARSRGWAPCGVDISAEAIRYAREELGLTVYQGEVDNCGFVPESFDAVCMIGTIEHMTDPVKALRSTARLLKMNGLLLILNNALFG